MRKARVGELSFLILGAVIGLGSLTFEEVGTALLLLSTSKLAGSVTDEERSEFLNVLRAAIAADAVRTGRKQAPAKLVLDCRNKKGKRAAVACGKKKRK